MKETKILSRVYEEYTPEQIKAMEKMYNDNVTFDLSLKIKIGDIIKGRIIHSDKDYYLFDISYKDYVRVEKRKNEEQSLLAYSNYDEDSEKYSIDVNTEFDILIVDIDDKNHLIKGSLASLNKQKAYSKLLADMNTVLVGKVVEVLPKGLVIHTEYNGCKIQTFMPNYFTGVNKLNTTQLQNMLGTNIEIMFESFSEETGSFISSRKKYLQSLVPIETSKLINIANGEPVLFNGLVTGTTKYGIFVEFNDILTCMIHKDNMNPETYNSYGSIKPGTEMSFYIKEYKDGKIIASQLWTKSVFDTLQKNQVLEGTVVSILEHDTLIRLDEHTVGVVANKKNKSNLTVDSTVKVKVSSIKTLERIVKLLLV